ncbi:MAG: substrate-binding domain-containing protein [Micropruina sp.]|nr:substrate-binding domain-containing protein [Micropruina sp.]
MAIREHYGVGDRFVNAIDGFLDTQVDALVIAAEPGHDFPDLGIPTVIEGTRLHSVAGCDHVSNDVNLGVGLALRHLQSLGHRRIGHVTGLGGSAEGRLRAYLQFMESVGEPLATPANATRPTRTAATWAPSELLRRHPEVTAVFAANDTMALGARAALREVGGRGAERCRPGGL